MLLLLASSVAALLAGSGYAATLSAGLITVDPSEPGRLLVTLGGAVFALIVAVGQGRRAGAMGQVALFGLALIDLALAIPIGLAPIVILLVGSASLSALAAGEKEDAQRARAVFRDLVCNDLIAYRRSRDDALPGPPWDDWRIPLPPPTRTHL